MTAASLYYKSGITLSTLSLDDSISLFIHWLAGCFPLRLWLLISTMRGREDPQKNGKAGPQTCEKATCSLTTPFGRERCYEDMQLISEKWSLGGSMPCARVRICLQVLKEPNTICLSPHHQGNMLPEVVSSTSQGAACFRMHWLSSLMQLTRQPVL